MIWRSRFVSDRVVSPRITKRYDIGSSMSVRNYQCLHSIIFHDVLARNLQLAGCLHWTLIQSTGWCCEALGRQSTHIFVRDRPTVPYGTCLCTWGPMMFVVSWVQHADKYTNKKQGSLKEMRLEPGFIPLQNYLIDNSSSRNENQREPTVEPRHEIMPS
jgi:hypothetical protein